MDKSLFFHYKTGSSFLHRMKPWTKILLMLVLAIGAFYAPVQIVPVLLFLLILFESFYLNVTSGELFSDFKPVIAYFTLMMISTVIANMVSFFEEGIYSSATFIDYARILIPDESYVKLLAGLALSVKISGIFYRTTSNSQFREGFSSIERCITRKKNAPFAETLALTITFIPRLVGFWNEIDTAWQARGGKRNLRRIKKLTPTLFKVSMREANLKSMARQNRM